MPNSQCAPEVASGSRSSAYSACWILARLRHHTFHSLAEINAAIATLLVELNERCFQRLPYSRRELFERLDRPAMRPLPEHPYAYAEWSYVKPGIDYHVEVCGTSASGSRRA